MSFFQNRRLSKSKISWTSPGFYQQPKTRCRFGVARTGVRRHQGHQPPNLESNPTAAVHVRFDCRLKFRVGVVKGSQGSFWWTRRRLLSSMRPQRALRSEEHTSELQSLRHIV